MDAPGLRTLDEYELGPLLAEGLAGTSYLSRAPSPGRAPRQVVLKLLHPRRGGLAPEAGACLGDLDPHVVRYEALGEAPPGWSGYYATDYVQTLDWAALRATTRPAEQLRVLRRLAETVAALHARPRPLVHGALRPEVVRLRPDRSGAATPLIDEVGVELRYDPEFHDAPERAAALYPYLAPEQLEALRRSGAFRPTPAGDVYALGALLCLLLAGAPPALADGATTTAELLAAHGRACFLQALLEPEDGVDLGIVNRLLERALARKPSERPTALWFADALQAALSPIPRRR